MILNTCGGQAKFNPKTIMILVYLHQKKIWISHRQTNSVITALLYEDQRFPLTTHANSSTTKLMTCKRKVRAKLQGNQPFDVSDLYHFFY